MKRSIGLGALFRINDSTQENGEEFIDTLSSSAHKKRSMRISRPFKRNILRFNKSNIQGDRDKALKRSSLRLKNLPSCNIYVKPVEKVTKIYSKRALEAPNMTDDFYLNLLDWSKENVIAIGLECCVFLLNDSNNQISQIIPSNGKTLITSVSWMTICKNRLAIGLNNGRVEIWDTDKLQRIRTLKGHSKRVSALSWNCNILSTGSLDSLILSHDVRDKSHLIDQFKYHSKEVCGLKWSPDGIQLASGSNDNHLCIWDINIMKRPKFALKSHKAAVKALSWASQDKNLLVSGGGKLDKSIKFWDTEEGTEIYSLRTNGQVCSLLWSDNSRELVTSHGYEKSQFFVWKYLPHKPEMPLVQTGELIGHKSRILHTTLSPNGSTVASTSPEDQTLRFWRVFDKKSEFPFSDFIGPSSFFKNVFR
ncbi:unnamed protein product [Moneuplotes crassus]|uniref:CDC20/Fizzy WD40 domain-containing protein n=1 Tax=Euplotes crassus TaxID=5936 RepID=A0AAD1UB87_EUPCR|nr:unnamed protein product [Moneuplotes crassus]